MRVGALHARAGGRDIAGPTADAIRASGLRKVALLATRFTMGEAHYVARPTERHGLSVLTSPPEDRALVHRVIHEERAMANLIARGAEGVILGCIEGASLRLPGAPERC
jgi:aspartate racemase